MVAISTVIVVDWQEQPFCLCPTYSVVPLAIVGWPSPNQSSTSLTSLKRSPAFLDDSLV